MRSAASALTSAGRFWCLAWCVPLVVCVCAQVMPCPSAPVALDSTTERIVHYSGCNAVAMSVQLNEGSNHTSLTLENCTIARIVFGAAAAEWSNVSVVIRSCTFTDTPGVEMGLRVLSHVTVRITQSVIGGGTALLVFPLIMSSMTVAARWVSVSIAVFDVEVPKAMTAALVSIAGPEIVLTNASIVFSNVAARPYLVPGRRVYDMQVATVMLYLGGAVSVQRSAINVSNVALACNYQSLMFAAMTEFYDSAIDMVNVTLNTTENHNDGSVAGDGTEPLRAYCVCGNMTTPTAAAMAVSQQAWAVNIGTVGSGSAVRMTRCRFDYVGNFTVLWINTITGDATTVVLDDWRVRWTTWVNMSRTSVIMVGSISGGSVSLMASNHAVTVDGVMRMESSLIGDPSSWVRVPETMQASPPLLSVAQSMLSYARIGSVTNGTVLVSNTTIDAAGEGITALRIAHAATNATVGVSHCHMSLRILYFASLFAPNGWLEDVSMTVADSSVRSLGNGNVSLLYGSGAVLVRTTAVVQRSVFVAACVEGLPLWTVATFFMMVRWGTVVEGSLVAVRDMGSIRITTYSTNTTFGVLHVFFRLINATAMVVNTTDVYLAGVFGTEIFSLLTVASHINGTAVMDGVRATIGPNGGFCGFCGVLDGSVLNITSTVVLVEASAMPPYAFIPTSLVLPRPSYGGHVTVANSRMEVVSLVGAVAAAIFTAASMTHTVVDIVNASLRVSCVGGTVSVASCGVATYSSVSIRNVEFTTSNPISTSVLGAVYAVDTVMSLDNVSVDVQTVGNVACIGFLQFLSNVTVVLLRVSTTTTTAGLTSSMVGRPAMSDALAAQYFPLNLAQNASNELLDTGVVDVSIRIAACYWHVTCVPAGPVTGDCVLLGIHGAQQRNTITVADTVAVLKAVVGDYVFTGGPMGAVLLAAAPQYGLGDFAQPMSSSDVQLNDVSVSLTNVAVTCTPVLAGQRVALFAFDAFGGNNTWRPQLPQLRGVSLMANNTTLEAPWNATVVQVGMWRRSNNTYALRDTRVVFTSTTAAATSGAQPSWSSFRLVVAYPLYAPDAVNCTLALNATLSGTAHKVTVVRAACTDASATRCDHVVVDLSAVAPPTAVPLQQHAAAVVNAVWENAAAHLGQWSVVFESVVGASPAPQGGLASMLHCALLLTGGNVTVRGASRFGVEAPWTTAIATTAPASYVMLDALVLVAVGRWLDASTLTVTPAAGALSPTNGNGTVVALSAAAWVQSKPAVYVGFGTTGCSKRKDGATPLGASCASQVVVEGVVFAFGWLTSAGDVAATMSMLPMATLCIAATDLNVAMATASVNDAGGSGPQPPLVTVVVTGVSMRVGDGNGATTTSHRLPTRTTGLVLLRAAQRQGVSVTITGSTLDMQRGTVTAGTEPTEAVLVVAPPVWMDQSMSAFPYTSLIASNAVVVPQGKRSVKTTYTVAVRPEAPAAAADSGNNQAMAPHGGGGWSVPGTYTFQTPVVECNVVNGVYPLVRADPTAIPQNITPRCDSFTQEPTQTATCLGDTTATMAPSHAPLYDAYRYGVTVTISAPSPQTFAIPVAPSGSALTHLARASWGSVRSVGGGLCDNATAASSAQVKGTLRCQEVIVVLDVAEYVVLSAVYGVDVVLSNSIRDCPGGPEGTYALTLDPVAYPTPVVARDASGAVAAVTTLVGGVVVSPGIGFAMARSALVLQLSLCAYSDSEPMTRYDSPFGWSFGGVDGAFLRGSVLGNCAMVVLMVVLTLLVSLVLHVHRRRITNKETVQQALRLISLQSLSARTHCPSNLVIPGSWILQATVASSVALLGARWDGGADVVVGLLGLGAPVGLLLKYYHCILFRLPKSCRGTRTRVPMPVPLTPLGCLDWFMEPNTVWKQLHSAEDPLFKRKYFEIFTQYVPEYRWFLIVETLSCVVLGILQGMRPTETSGCQRIAYAVLSVCLGSFFLCAWVRPYATRFDECILQFNNIFTAVCAVLLAVPDSEAGDLAASADAIAMVQVYVSTALTALWLLHHLHGVRTFLASSLGRPAPALGRSPPHRWSSRKRRVVPATDCIAVVPTVEAPMGEVDPRTFHRRVAALSAESRMVRQRLAMMSMPPITRGVDVTGRDAATAAERVELLLRLICMERLLEQIRTAQRKWNAS